MVKLILSSVLFVFSTPLLAESCFPLYHSKASEIQIKGANTQYVAAQVYVHNGQIGYWPGIPVPGHVDNWSQDFVDAIKWGPLTYTPDAENPRKDWLEAFRKSVKDDCKLPQDNYDNLRTMLNELMEDGSLCPQNKILEPKFLAGKSAFTKILKAAVKDQRFVQYCQGQSVKDDSQREPKNIEDKNPEKALSPRSVEQ